MMITELEAKRRIISGKKEKPYSCAIMEHFYVFCMKKEESIFYAVDKRTGKIYPYSPSLDFIGYNQATKHVYGE